MTEQTPLDSILSRDSAPAPSQDISTPSETPTQAKTDEQPRTPGGQFAQKPKDEPSAPPAAQPNEPRGVPPAALQAERAKRQEKDAEIARLEGQIAQLTAMYQQQPRAPQPPPAPPAPPPDPYADPEGYAQHVAREMVSPIEQRVEKQQDFMSRRLAEMEHKPETVQAALAAMYAAEQAGDQSALAELQRMKRSQHPYGELVTWHRQRTALSEIGTDPEAYKAKVRAELMAELQGGQSTAPAVTPPAQQPHPVMPSNLANARNVGTRTGPTWSGPQSINDIFNRGRK